MSRIATVLSLLIFSIYPTFGASEAVAADQEGKTLQMSEALPRRTLLGIQPERNAPGVAVTIRQVIPNSTAAALGMKVGDKLVSVNQNKIGDFSELLSVIGTLSTGNHVQVDVLRNGKSITLEGSMQPRPFEVSDVAEVTYESVQYQGNHLRSILYKPLGFSENQKAPAILFIQGYTCSSIDYGMLPYVTTRQLLEQLVAAGNVVYRVEKPGMGDSQSTKHCRDIDFTEENQAFLQALKHLKNKPFVDPERTYLWGHSLGVLHAPLVAQQEKVAGIIGYGGVFKGWYDYMLDIYAVQAVKHFSTSPRQAKRNTKRMQPFLNLWLNTQTPWQEVLKDKSVQGALSDDLLTIDGDQVVDRHYSFFRDLNQYDFANLWKQLNVPVLMMHGSFDIQAIEPQWAFDIAKQTQHPNSQAVVIKGAEHGFMRYKTNEEHMAARNNGQYNPGNPQSHFDPRIGQQTIEWLAKQG
ncbi:MAG: alpha/beta fold hydrolase [Alteromonadaceae bacterium]|nr:alpha/beta fold hydrolase [Alteromonadaceae bacterium]